MGRERKRGPDFFAHFVGVIIGNLATLGIGKNRRFADIRKSLDAMINSNSSSVELYSTVGPFIANYVVIIQHTEETRALAYGATRRPVDILFCEKIQSQH